MKTLIHTDRIKIMRGLTGGAAWAAIIAAGMIMGIAITAQAARTVPEFAAYHQKDAAVPPFERFGTEPVVSEDRDTEPPLDEPRIFPNFNERLLQTNAPLRIHEVPPGEAADKGRWNFIKIRDVQKDGKEPIARLEF